MLFITFEGIDGAGKTTIIKMVKEKIAQHGYDILVTREPGGDAISEKIRDFILDVENVNLNPWAEALLYIASRKQHLDSVIIPALKEDKIVISDRYMDSTTVYQGFARGLGMEEIDEIQALTLGHAIPDITIFLDINPEEARERINSRNYKDDRMDSEDLSFHKKVYEGYQLLISQNPDRIKIVDARLPIIEVVERVEFIILNLLQGNFELNNNDK